MYRGGMELILVFFRKLGLFYLNSLAPLNRKYERYQFIKSHSMFCNGANECRWVVQWIR